MMETFVLLVVTWLNTSGTSGYLMIEYRTEAQCRAQKEYFTEEYGDNTAIESFTIECEAGRLWTT